MKTLEELRAECNCKYAVITETAMRSCIALRCKKDGKCTDPIFCELCELKDGSEDE